MRDSLHRSRPVLACRTLLAALFTAAVSAGAAADTADTAKPILVVPTLQWDATGVAWSYAAQQTPSDFARITGGLKFGLPPEETSHVLPGARATLHWTDLPQAKEYAEDVRYIWMTMGAAGALRAPVTSCFGDTSYVVLLFLRNALFRISWRFLPGPACPSPHRAAEEMFGAFTPLVSDVAVSARYASGAADVVDVTDPAAGPLVAQRWLMPGR